MPGKRKAKLAPTVRVHPRTRDQLRRLSKASGRSTPDLLADAVDRIDEEGFWDAVNEGFARLREDDKAWNEYLAERREWQRASDPFEDE